MRVYQSIRSCTTVSEEHPMNSPDITPCLSVHIGRLDLKIQYQRHMEIIQFYGKS